MSDTIRILHLEDSPLDAELIQKKLLSSGIVCQVLVVSDENEFRRALTNETFELILCDYNVPGFSGLAALQLSRNMRPEIPVIIISGTLDEEEAVDCLRNGATDYILKQRLQRLGPSVTRAITEATERVKLTSAKNAETRMTEIMEATPDFIATSLPDGRMLYYNPGARQMLGLAEGEDISKITIPDVYPEWCTRLVLNEGIPTAIHTGIWQGETAFRRRDGSEVPVSQVIIAHKNEEGELQYLSTIARDISARKEMEEAIKQSEELFRNILETTPDGILLVGSDGFIVLANPMAEKIFGALLLGKPISALLPAYPITQSAIHSPMLPEKQNMIGKRADDSEFPAEILCNNMTLPGQQLRLIVIRDITEQRMLEKQLRQSQKMEAIGQLTGGLAHDFNNMLGIIIGNLDLLELELSTNESAKKKVAASLKAALLGASLTKRLLAFARKQTLSPRTISITSEIEETLPLIERIMKGTCHIKQVVEPDLPNVVIDPAEFENALLNLAINARDAMPDGGNFIIEAQQLIFTPDDTWHLGSDFKPGAYVRVSLTDTGSGIHPDVLEHIFEPFFTTKEKGKGTGLGLAMVYGFIKQSQGHIKVYSELGRGTTFHIYLPIAPNSPITASPLPLADHSGDVSLRGRHVLVVDDEPDLADIARTYLESEGMQVKVIIRSNDAVELFKEGVRFDLVLSDIVMPGNLDGLELRQQILAIAPETPFLFASGFSEEAIKARIGGLMDTPILQKPFRKNDLLQAVNLAINSRINKDKQP